jgi:Protein of unknown function (DUF1641)
VTSVSRLPSASSPDTTTTTTALAERLADPHVAASLNTLLDHVDLLAVLVTGLDELISRGETITDSLATGVSELRAASEQPRVDAARMVKTVQQLSALAPPLLDKLPVLENLLSSDLADPRAIDVAGTAARAVVAGADQAQASQPKITGIRALLRALRDPDVSRALGFAASIAKALGKELNNAG